MEKIFVHVEFGGNAEIYIGSETVQVPYCGYKNDKERKEAQESLLRGALQLVVGDDELARELTEGVLEAVRLKEARSQHRQGMVERLEEQGKDVLARKIREKDSTEDFWRVLSSRVAKTAGRQLADELTEEEARRLYNETSW
ncbi:MAG TPA: hypothetical protein VFM02_01455 [Candidatus Paceibacterota bacterium]|nr:hypothetical protein [Candidatus Paceibacterota bacterium]